MYRINCDFVGFKSRLSYIILHFPVKTYTTFVLLAVSIFLRNPGVATAVEGGGRVWGSSVVVGASVVAPLMTVSVVADALGCGKHQARAYSLSCAAVNGARVYTQL